MSSHNLRMLLTFPIAVVSIVTILASGGGGGGSSSTTTISGGGFDGPVTGATVNIYDATNTLIGTGTTGSDAKYSISVPSNSSAPLRVEMSGGTDQISGEAMVGTMQSIVSSLGSSTVTANVTPISTLVYEAVKAKAGTTDSDISAIKADDIANVQGPILQKFGFGIDKADDGATALDPITDPVSADNIAVFTKASEALAEMVRRTVGQTKTADKDKIQSGDAGAVNALFTMLASDISDGVLDGAKDSTAVAAISVVSSGWSADELISQVNLQTANVAAEVMSNELTVTTSTGEKTAADVKTAMATAVATVESTVTNAATKLTALKVTSTLKQQAEAAVAAAVAGASAASQSTTALTALQTAIGNISAGSTISTIETAETITSTILSDVDTSVSAVSTALAATTEVNVAAANQAASNLTSFKLSNNTITVTDYDSSGASCTAQNVSGVVASGAMVAGTLGASSSAGITLHSGNLEKLYNQTGGTVPSFSLALDNGTTGGLPIGSGTATLSATIKDCNATCQSAADQSVKQSGERKARVGTDSYPVTINWSSDGTTLTLTAVAGETTAIKYFTTDGVTELTKYISNESADVWSTSSTISKGGAGMPAQLDTKLTSLFNQLPDVFDNVTVSGTYYFQVDLEGFPMVDSSGTSFTTIKGLFDTESAPSHCSGS